MRNYNADEYQYMIYETANTIPGSWSKVFSM